MAECKLKVFLCFILAFKMICFVSESSKLFTTVETEEKLAWVTLEQIDPITTSDYK